VTLFCVAPKRQHKSHDRLQLRFYSATGGLVVWPGSHKLHKRLMQHARGNDFIKISAAMVGAIGETIKPMLVRTRAGDLVLWDSRTGTQRN
jgi:ectoine hydroxylase-related dioxygenase (phytanoyl-CoA dioxygenase family)